MTALGKRTDESADRKRGMLQSGEATGEVVIMSTGEQVFCPIADFTLNDIARYIGRCGSDISSRKLESYSDFKDLLRVYRDANGGNCMISIYSTGRASTTGCGSRTGCHICLRVGEDGSMINMLSRPENTYMRPLNDFRNYLKAKHFDPKSRNWLSRSLNEDGTVTLAPNSYSPDFCIELLQFALSIDAEERAAARNLGIKPRFTLLRFEDVLAIDILWSRYGLHTTSKALEILYDIDTGGSRYPVPTNTPVHSDKALKVKLTNTKIPFADKDYYSAFSGLRDAYSAQADCENLVNKHGVAYSNVNTDLEFGIDEEGAELFYTFEYENYLKSQSNSGWNPTQVIHYFLGIGLVHLNKGGHSRLDKILRMANQIHRHGIRSILNDPEALIKHLSGHIPCQFEKVTEEDLHERYVVRNGDKESTLDLLSLLERDAGRSGVNLAKSTW